MVALGRASGHPTPASQYPPAPRSRPSGSAPSRSWAATIFPNRTARRRATCGCARASYENSPVTTATAAGPKRKVPIMASTIDGDDKIVEFPKTAEERRAFRKAKLDMERRRITNCFIDTTGLFRTPAGVGYADLNVAEVRQTWPVKSREFRFAYVRYLRGKYEAILDMDTIQALAVGQALNKSV